MEIRFFPYQYYYNSLSELPNFFFFFYIEPGCCKIASVFGLQIAVNMQLVLSCPGF